MIIGVGGDDAAVGAVVGTGAALTAVPVDGGADDDDDGGGDPPELVPGARVGVKVGPVVGVDVLAGGPELGLVPVGVAVGVTGGRVAIPVGVSVGVAVAEPIGDGVPVAAGVVVAVGVGIMPVQSEDATAVVPSAKVALTVSRENAGPVNGGAPEVG
jgi:hypothetical protein